uniref:Succinyl-CoA:3-ketoacid-coenzyme A transferase n=1 Tax=Trichuris muris TaxID=70415 RepID=A0A5S6QNC1_TRIMR
MMLQWMEIPPTPIRPFATSSTLRRNKEFTSLEAVKDIPSGSRLLVGGIGVCGIPSDLIKSLSETGITDLTIVSSTCGIENFGLGWLFSKQMVKRVIATFVDGNPEFTRQYFDGKLELEIIPQGTLAERIRAGGAGIPAFYTQTGCSTVIESGGWPVKYKANGEVDIISESKERRLFDNVPYILEHAINGDFALVRAWKGDRAGNLVFRKMARNFNVPMAKAAKVCIAEVEELCEVGAIDPDDVDLPGIYVHRVVRSSGEKLIERLVHAQAKQQFVPATAARHRIARRAVLELKDGAYANLGIGIPSLCPLYIPKDITVTLQSDVGILGLGPYPEAGQEDPDLINAAKETVTVLPGASYFSSDESFAMIRGGHLDMTILGAMQVSCQGDFASWVVPRKVLKGIGGAMDLVSSPKTKVVICMEHLSKQGEPKIVSSCTLPITGEKAVDMIITEKCVFNVTKDFGLLLTELGEDVTLEDVIQSTDCEFKVADVVKPMKDL